MQAKAVSSESCCSSHLSNAGTCECDRSYTKQTHWLSFPKRVMYKLCVLLYKCLHGTAPDYLSRHLVSISPVPGRTRLRSTTAGLLVVPFVPSKTIGSNRSFAYCAPVTWNQLHKLSPGLCDPTMSLATFKKHLKTFLYVNNDVLLNSTR